MKSCLALVLALVAFTATASVEGSDAPIIINGKELPPPSVGLTRTEGKSRGATGNYYLSTFTADFSTARSYCASTRTQLLIIKDHVKQSQIAGFYRTEWGSRASSWIWLGGEKYNGVFEWGDFTPILYSNFMPGYTNEDGECLNMIGPDGYNPIGQNKYTWMQLPCNSLGYFVCEDKN